MAATTTVSAMYYSRSTMSSMVSRVTSYRLDADLKARLEQQAAAEGITERALLERLVGEGLDSADFPGIVFRDGPTGRRAALAVGGDVWEVVSALRYVRGRPERRVGELADQFGLHPRQIRIALDYAAMHRDEIDAEVRANDAAAERARVLAEQRAELMAS